ncbi:TPA: hypothetical protein RUZ94_000656 [Vibrio cholerae]|uniref:hypothetical protein n=1 Tax=Vibrio cholerae TaxID=666 RepID=UPI001A250B4F|nr:hypothetical protein [Vibrio cholerae]MDV2306368.1 hypothetical protein [Vibrio cholerae]HAS3598724.1 hypothetical protein [Vibrio cholerae]HDZ3768548.1 hypothetical protein [Vibrio cholerae]HDZ9497822.1 hypothetical protein [Vibrio cholerae]
MPKAKQKPLNHIAKLIAEVYEEAGLDQPYIEGKKLDMSGHENKFETLASAINLDAENRKRLATKLGISSLHLDVTVRVLNHHC